MPVDELLMRLSLHEDRHGHYLVNMDTGRWYARVRSSNKKQGEQGLLEIIRQEIARHGHYDPDREEHESEDVS